MRELFEKYPVLEVAFVELAHEIIRTAPWGLMWRVGLGSVLSVVDVITDINVILNFRAGGVAQAGYYIATAASTVNYIAGMDGSDITYARLVSRGENGTLETEQENTTKYDPGGTDPSSNTNLTLADCGDDLVLFFFAGDNRQ